MNRAVHGDVVAVEVFDETQWKASANEVVDQDTTLRNDDAEGTDSKVEGETDEVALRESRVVQEEARSSDKQPTGRIVGIIKRNWRAYVCHVDSTSLTTSNSTSLSLQTVFATPVSRLLPRIRLRTRQAPSLLNQKILVTIDRWDPSSRYPEGHFVRALGRVESKEAEQESLLLEFEVPYRPFGKAILDCLPEGGDAWVVPVKGDDLKEWKGREDLRELVICSIDPPGGHLSLSYRKDFVLIILFQDVKISTMHYTPGSYLTGILRLVFVRQFFVITSCNLFTAKPSRSRYR
jgi:exosome complex exonuclease DIS3/RRP44